MLTVGGRDVLTKRKPKSEEIRYASGTTRDADRDRHVDDGPCSRTGHYEEGALNFVVWVTE
jgi:hypothetical protein